jgi:hypothetical protein
MFPKDIYPNLYNPTAEGLLRRGLRKYMKKHFQEAHYFFVQSSRLDSTFTTSLAAQGFALLKLQCFQEAVRSFSMLPASVTLSQEVRMLPLEWRNFESQHWVLISCYQHALYLFANGAFREALARLNSNLKISPNHILSLDLKFKCLLNCLSTQNQKALHVCGAQLKAFATEKNILLQKLSSEEQLMVKGTLRRYLKASLQ